MNLPMFYVDELILCGLREDINYLDTTTDYLIPEAQTDSARFIAKAQGVVCGMTASMRVFEMLDKDFGYEVYKDDGARVVPGDVLCEFSGRTRALLKGERTALNLIQHMSGIATATATAVALCEGTKACIADTRKTLPGLRALQKYAVTVGGGKNHRFNLSDGAMLKDNHIDAGGGITNAIRTLRGAVGHMVRIEVETRTLDEVEEALQAQADIIMLDNMDLATMREAVKRNAGRAVLEASGGVHMGTLRDIVQTGVDIVSIGALTHSVTAFDISMRMA